MTRSMKANVSRDLTTCTVPRQARKVGGKVFVNKRVWEEEDPGGGANNKGLGNALGRGSRARFKGKVDEKEEEVRSLPPSLPPTTTTPRPVWLFLRLIYVLVMPDRTFIHDDPSVFIFLENKKSFLKLFLSNLFDTSLGCEKFLSFFFFCFTSARR